jgi:hypothetical protein
LGKELEFDCGRRTRIRRRADGEEGNEDRESPIRRIWLLARCIRPPVEVWGTREIVELWSTVMWWEGVKESGISNGQRSSLRMMSNGMVEECT